jgi:hypothetical protein
MDQGLGVRATLGSHRESGGADDKWSFQSLAILLLGCIHIWSVDIPGPFYGDLQLISASECSAGAALVSLDSCMAGIPVSLPMEKPDEEG